MPSGRPVELAGRGQHRVLGLHGPDELPAPAGLFLVELRAGIERAEARDVHVLEELVVIAPHPRLAAVECLDLHILEPCCNRTRLVRFRLADRLWPPGAFTAPRQRTMRSSVSSCLPFCLARAPCYDPMEPGF